MLIGHEEVSIVMETELCDRMLRFLERVLEMREAQKQHIHLMSNESLYKVLVLERIVDDERCLLKARLEMDRCQRLESERASNESAISVTGDSSQMTPAGSSSHAPTAAK